MAVPFGILKIFWLPYACHYYPLLIRNRSWMLTINRTKRYLNELQKVGKKYKPRVIMARLRHIFLEINAEINIVSKFQIYLGFSMVWTKCFQILKREFFKLDNHCVNGNWRCYQLTVKSRAIDQSTIQFWTLWAKGHST